MNQPERKTKVAILGGGIAGLATAYELIAQPQGQERYDITVYQMGWRLGGKGASGRNPDAGERIEEHGLHVWSGFYENAFALMRRCYPQLRRVPGKDPLATVFPAPDQPEVSPAFRQHNCEVIEEFINGEWLDWVQVTPSNSLLPGSGRELSLWDSFKIALGWMVDLIEDLIDPSRFAGASAGRPLPEWVVAIVKEIKAEAEHLFGKGQDGIAAQAPAPAPAPEAKASLLVVLERDFVQLALQIAAKLETHPVDHPAASHRAIDWLIGSFLKWLGEWLGDALMKDTVLRRLFILVDMIGTTIRGVIRDGVLVHGTPVIDHYDFRQWLQLHGAHDVTAYSGLVRGYYDYCFAYEHGDPSKPSMAAGTALLHLSRLTMQDSGAIFWKMQAGMGDTVFTPLYLVLRDLGVKFEFFHEVKDLHLSRDKFSVERIDLEVQATVTEAAKQRVHTVQGRDYSGSYWPLVDVKDLPCWPSAPLYEQLAEGPVLREKRVDLECPWADWDGVGARTLVCGQDYDLAVLAMSLGPLKYVTKELMDASTSWRNMVEQLKTTQTVGVQIWCKSNWQQLGWEYQTPLITAYAQPIQTWGDFSQVLPREAWPADNAPGSVSYLCGNLPDPEHIPDFSDHAFPRVQYERVRSMAWQWLSDNADDIWPKASPSFDPTGINWNELYDPKNGGNPARFNAQWFRANISPSERYVLCVPKDKDVRMKQGKTPFANLYVAGDYVYTGILGSIEASVMTGMMASRAISGFPQKIFGEVVAE
jgi:uncharacterized protein with NAD-binding domain and iron-sulfur cluster